VSDKGDIPVVGLDRPWKGTTSRIVRKATVGDSIGLLGYNSATPWMTWGRPRLNPPSLSAMSQPITLGLLQWSRVLVRAKGDNLGT